MKGISSPRTSSFSVPRAPGSISPVKELKDGIRSQVRIDFEGKVHKTFRGTNARERCENEIRILKALEERECPYVPKLLGHNVDELTIITTNCGQPAPHLSKRKADSLFAELEASYGVRHDDPEPRNVTYDPWAGRFCIIDFELSELLPMPAPDAPHPEAFRLRWSACSDSGAAGEGNDEAWIAVELSEGRGERLDDHGERFLDPYPLLFAVADGIGGGRAGELASRLLLAGMRRKLPGVTKEDSREWKERIRRLIHQSHEELNELGKREENLQRMGCTLTMAVFHGKTLIMGHVGDSRLYRCRDGETTQLSKDHTFAFSSWKRGEINERAFRSHPRRSALYDAMGGGHDSLVPLVEQFESQPGDRYLFCTDGLIDGLWERQIQEIMAQDGPPEEIRDELLRRARSSCEMDDATLIVVDFSHGNG